MTTRAKQFHIIEPWSVWVACILFGMMVSTMAIGMAKWPSCTEGLSDDLERFYDTR